MVNRGKAQSTHYKEIIQSAQWGAQSWATLQEEKNAIHLNDRRWSENQSIIGVNDLSKIVPQILIR